MKLIAVFFSAILVAGLGSCDRAQAQPNCPPAGCVSPNLIFQIPAGTTNPTTSGWTGGAANYTGTGGGVSGGSQPAYNANNNTLYFGYQQGTLAYTYALNTALQNSGMTWTGYNYSWDYINQDYSKGTLSANLSFNSTNGTSLYSKSWTLGPTTNGWTTFSGTETFTSPGLAAANLGNFKLSFTGKDDRFWAGYYGPQVKNPTLSVNYTFDVCSSNPLSSPTCPGYAAAYQTQQCTANPLYNSSCPGYAAAYQTQQCTANPLYSPDCPGYASAYLTQQCNQNPLYSTTCQGYETAYLNQQCSINPLYSTRCSGYAAAYKSQQCSINPLYDSTCDGYASAYKTQQCSINVLYDPSCPGYATAYLKQQCDANPLYSTQCSGYAVAYKNQQCSLNPLYSTDCAGYQAAYHNQQCSINPLYMTDCAGYQQAYFNQQCSLNGLYDTKCPNYATAYATKMVLEQQNMASTVATAGVVASTAPKTTTVDTTTGTVSSTPSTTGSTTVDKVITPTTTTANTAAAPAAPVQLVPQQQPQGTPMAPQQAQQDKKPEGPKQEGGPQGMAQAPQGGEQKQEGPKTARQEIQERRMEAAKTQAAEKGKDAQKDMDKAASLEQQKQVQNVVIQAMGFTPGFDVYGKVFIQDAAGYKPFTVYNNQKVVDNRRTGNGLFGPTDRLHTELVDSQYKEK